jgi:hypothetical protein
VSDAAAEALPGQCIRRLDESGGIDGITENDEVHGIINAGSVDAGLYIGYLIKHAQPHRRDEEAPACAIDTPIP